MALFEMRRIRHATLPHSWLCNAVTLRAASTSWTSASIRLLNAHISFGRLVVTSRAAQTAGWLVCIHFMPTKGQRHEIYNKNGETKPTESVPPDCMTGESRDLLPVKDNFQPINLIIIFFHSHTKAKHMKWIFPYINKRTEDVVESRSSDKIQQKSLLHSKYWFLVEILNEAKQTTAFNSFYFSNMM